MNYKLNYYYKYIEFDKVANLRIFVKICKYFFYTSLLIFFEF